MQLKEIKQHGQVYVATWHRHSQTQGPQMPTLALIQLKLSAVLISQIWTFQLL